MDIRETAINSLADSIKRLMERFANNEGVSVRYHRQEPRILFTFTTNDKLVVEVDYDINQTSKQYINNMISGILVNIEKRRKERHDNPIIVTSRVH